MFRAHSKLRSVFFPIFFCAVACVARFSFAASTNEAKPHWLLVSSSHFSVLTDGDEKKANEVLLRMEQMRVVFGQLLQRDKLIMPEPLDIIAFNTREEYSRFTPLRDGQPLAASGFFCRGKTAIMPFST